MVMSPLSSTSWQTTAFEWIVNLSRLGGRERESGWRERRLNSHRGHVRGRLLRRVHVGAAGAGCRLS